MKKKFSCYILFGFIFIMLLQTGSCVPQACLEDMEITAKASFYATGTGILQTPDSVTLYGLGRDTSKIYDNAPKLQTIEIPLDAGAESCRFILKINGIADTVTFIYTSYPHLVTKECGYTYYHTIDQIINTLTSVDYLIGNRQITNANEENFRIFY